MTIVVVNVQGAGLEKVVWCKRLRALLDNGLIACKCISSCSSRKWFIACCWRGAYLLHSIHEQPHMASLPEHNVQAVEQRGSGFICILGGHAATGRRCDQHQYMQKILRRSPLNKSLSNGEIACLRNDRAMPGPCNGIIRATSSSFTWHALGMVRQGFLLIWPPYCFSRGTT